LSFEEVVILTINILVLATAGAMLVQFLEGFKYFNTGIGKSAFIGSLITIFITFLFSMEYGTGLTMAFVLGAAFEVIRNEKEESS